jgi:acyl-CoA synthetase (AMP-forming)/AMP-acid ligase II
MQSELSRVPGMTNYAARPDPSVESAWSVLVDVLLHRAATDPGRLAYDDGRGRITFGQLLDRAQGRAAALTELGVRQGDRVALTMGAGVPLTEIYWGLQLLGAVPAVFSPGAPPRRVAVAAPSFTIDDALASTLIAGSTEPERVSIDPEAIAFIQPTSGTSGMPRAAQVRHRNVLAFLDAASAHIRRDDILIAWVPPWHDLGLVRFLLGAVYYGASCHIVEPAIATLPDWMRKISEVGGTITGAPDFCYRLAARMVDPATVDISCLRYANSGGEPPRMSSIRMFEERFGVPGMVIPGYGLAEATLGVSAHDAGDEVVADARGNVSCGPALPGFEVRAGVSFEEPDEIVVRAEAVFAGYLDAPEDTAARLRDGWLHTGDSGYFDDQGRLFVLGRRAGMLKRGGAVVSPRELEEAAQAVADVRVAAAVGVDSDGGERIALVVEAVDFETDAARIGAAVSRAVTSSAGFAPDRVIVVAPRTIPRTENGKVRHGRLRSMLEDPALA